MHPLMLAVVLAATAPSPTPPRPSPSGVAAKSIVLSFGSTEARATAALGRPTRSWERQGFQWRRYMRGTTTIELGFYHDKLGIADVRPAMPMAWPEAKAWVCALVPGFDAAKLHKEPGVWTYFQNVLIDGVPFEVELRLECRGDRTTALHGEMHWLD